MNPFIQNNPLLTSIILFLIFFVMVQMLQPSFLYDTDGSIREFGIGYKRKTIFPLWLFSIVLGILCYLFVCYYIYSPRLFR
jgi:uncharacterized membrane protein YozB (DUF420 family)